VKRKTTTIPTRIYSYRCLPPLTEGDRVELQFRLAAQYRNALVEIEHRLRERIRAARLAHPQLGLALLYFEEAQAAVDDAYDEIRAAKSGARDPDLSAQREHLARAEDLRAMRASELREARAIHGPGLAPAYAEIREKIHRERLDARNVFIPRGLRQGTYDRVEKAVQQAAASSKRPLFFERYDGSGSIGTQLTEKGSDRGEANGVRGLTLPELYSAADTRLRLGPPAALDRRPHPLLAGVTSWDEAARLPRKASKHAARTWIDLRIGSNPDRTPIFARFPVVLHRPLPRGAVIKWAYVVRRRVGPNLEWHLQLTLESTTFDRPPIAIGSGACAVNLGWRRIFDEEGSPVALRAAYVVDGAGREREILLPEYTTSRGGGHDGPRRLSPFTAIGKIDDLAKIRDQLLECAQHDLSVWLAARGGVPSEWTSPIVRGDGTVGSAIADRLRGYASWRSCGKLRAVVAAWATARVAGDETIFAVLAAWAKKDRHLEEWAANQRAHMQAQRKDAWRRIAAELAQTYETILVGKGKIVEIAGWEKKRADEGDPSEGREQRRMSRLAAPGELRSEIEKAAHKTGARVIRCDEVRATQRCSACGHEDAEPWDAAPEITHRCAGCGRTWDQDANYCRNLLIASGYASGPVPPEDGEVRASHNDATSRQSSGSAAQIPMGPTKQ
jgi:hypothetical protein